MFPKTPVSLALHALVAGASLTLGAPADRVDFEKEIKPVLETACVRCHGAEKQKGKLRLDAREHWMKGGDGGPAFEAGDPEKSAVVQRIVLGEDQDDVMPPAGKGDHLTAAEIALIKRWITQGGEWPPGIVLASAPEESADDKAARIGPAPSHLDQDMIGALARRGIKVSPIASGVNWRRADLRSLGDKFTSADAAKLARISVLRELSLKGLAVGDEEIATFTLLKHLAVLDLANTKVTDAALPKLAAFTELTSLNLYGTQVSDAGLAALATLKRLKSVYLAGTKVTPAGISALKRALPKVEIESGLEFAEIAKPDPAPPKQPAATPAPSAKASPTPKPAQPAAKP